MEHPVCIVKVHVVAYLSLCQIYTYFLVDILKIDDFYFSPTTPPALPSALSPKHLLVNPLPPPHHPSYVSSKPLQFSFFVIFG